MRVKLPLGDLNSSPCPKHITSIYTCKVTITPWVCGCSCHISSLAYVAL